MRCLLYGAVFGVIGAVIYHVADLESAPLSLLVPAALTVGVVLGLILYGTQRLMHKQDRSSGK